MQRKKDHTKRPFSKYVQVKETRPNFFLLKIFLLCTQTSTWNTPPKNFHVDAPSPFSPFIFLFLLGASWRAGGRAGGGFLFSGSRDRCGAPPGGGNQGPVLPRVQSRTRHRGQRLGRWRRCLATVGDRPGANPRARARGRGRKGRRTVVHACAAAGAFAATGKSATVAVVIGLRLVLFGSVWFVFLCRWYCFSILVTTGGWLGGSGRGGAGRRTQKNSEA